MFHWQNVKVMKLFKGNDYGQRIYDHMDHMIIEHMDIGRRNFANVCKAKSNMKVLSMRFYNLI